MRIIIHWLLSSVAIKQNFDKVCPKSRIIIIFINLNCLCRWSG